MTDSESVGETADIGSAGRARSDWFASWAENVSEINARLETGRRATDEYLAVMARAIDEGLGEIVTTFDWRNAQLEARVDNLTASLAEQHDRIDAALAEQRERLNAVLDERDERLAQRTESAEATLRERIESERAATLSQLEAVSVRLDEQMSHRMAELRAGIEAEVLERIAAVAHDLANGRAALEAQIEALSGHAGRAEARAAEIGAELEVVRAQLATVDVDALTALESKVSNAVGEATLARIEVDRVTASVGERFDHVQVRLSEVETQLADTMDVSTAVQLERLDELERAVAELDPDQFMRNESYDPDAATGGDGRSAEETGGEDTSWAVERITDAASW